MAIPITPEKIRSQLYKTIDEMNQNLHLYVKHPGKDFSRESQSNSICSFKRTILCITNMEDHSLSREVEEFFNPFTAKRGAIITKSAFLQARGKLNENVFPALLDGFNQKFPFQKTFKGLHVHGIDGSDLNIPADKSDCSCFIPYNSNDGGYYQMHLNVCYDLVEKRYVYAVIQPRGEMKEVAAACEMVDRNPLSDPCLFIADRGYDSFNLMAHIVEKGNFYLIRLKEPDARGSMFKNVVVPDKEEFDISVEFNLTRSSKLVRQHPEKYKKLFPTRSFDFIDKNDRESVYSMSCRLIRIKLDTGAYEYLMTNLPEDKFPLSEMKDLYHLRWQVETSFLFLKYGVALNYFHSVKREFLIQEIYSRLILFNFISLIVSCVEVPNKGTKYTYKLSFSSAIVICRHFLLRHQYYENVEERLLKHKTPVRPDRSYPRNMRSQRLKSLQNRT